MRSGGFAAEVNPPLLAREGGPRQRCAANCIRKEPQATENAVSRFPFGWVGCRVAAVPAKQGIRTNPINPFCAFAAALLQGPAWVRIISHGTLTLLSRQPLKARPLREGGSPKGRGWICLVEAGPAKQGIHTNPINPSCGFAAALLQGPAWVRIVSHGTLALLSRQPLKACPLREGGSPKGGGWIRLAEARPAKQGIRTNPINPSCAFAAALLQGPAFWWITPTIEDTGKHVPPWRWRSCIGPPSLA
ncbi:MAG: hypothetical protein ACFWUL_10245 [Dialister sp.]